MTGNSPDPSNRRAFFRKAVSKIVEPLTDYLGTPESERPRTLLRPPGAIEESRFVDACLRCGSCIDACPANAIFAMNQTSEESVGTPMINPDHAACVVCDGLQCTHVCPSGALLPITDPSLINMGLAEVYGPVCLRSNGESCTICVERCPTGESAIRFDNDGPPQVLSDGCTGCGICQLYCPTTPKAIVVTPR